MFPVDGMPNGKWAQRLHYFRYKHLCKLLYFTYRDPYRHGRGPSSWLPLLCRKLYTVEGLQKKIRNLQTKYSFYKCKKVLCFDDGLRSVVDKEVYGTPKVYKFEDRDLMGVEDHHTLLTHMYGDYMTPPKSKQSTHINECYLKDED